MKINSFSIYSNNNLAENEVMKKISIHNSFEYIRHLGHHNQSTERFPQLKQSVKTLEKQSEQ